MAELKGEPASDDERFEENAFVYARNLGPLSGCPDAQRIRRGNMYRRRLEGKAQAQMYVRSYPCIREEDPKLNAAGEFGETSEPARFALSVLAWAKRALTK